jgi:LEA14-like dessication related protein
MKRVIGFSFLLGFFLSAVTLLLYGCKSPPPPPDLPPPLPQPTPAASIFLEGIEAQDVNRIVLRFTLEADNPRSEAAQVKAGLWDAEINGKRVADGVKLMAEPAIFHANAEASASTSVVMELDIPALTRAGISLESDYNVSLGTDLTFNFDSGKDARIRAAGTAVFPRIQEPVFNITSIAVLKAELVNTRFRVSLKVENPNPFPMELSSFEYELYGDGRFWADGREKKVLQIPGKSSAETRLFLLMNFIDMKRNLLDQIIALEDIRYRFGGEVQVSTGVDYLPNFCSAFDLSGYSHVFEN